jgi:predicted lipoprotein with Yx(FWY)xxD motif
LPNRVWLNDGSGIFSDSDQSLGDSPSNSVALGDVDGDGDLDAWVANHRTYRPNRVWLNDGNGTFSDSGQNLYQVGNQSNSVALGDVDGDGDLDAWDAVGDPSGKVNRVWLNDGSGVFSDSGQKLGYSYSNSVALGDVDGDGDLDAWVANNGANLVWLNDGNGNFSDSGQTIGSFSSRSVALGDLDGDGDLDAWVVNEHSANRVWLNVSPPPMLWIQLLLSDD